MSVVCLTPDAGLFELPGPKPLWIWAHTCPDPSCPCRTAILMSTEKGRDVLLAQGAPVRTAWNSGASYAKAAQDEVTGLLAFALDIDSGAAYPIDGRDRLDLQERRDVAAVVERIDGEVLDELGRLWLKGKGLANPEHVVQRAESGVLRGWKKGDMLPWNDVFKGVRTDLYWLGARLYEACETYCPDPRCDCSEVCVVFDTHIPRGGPTAGFVRVSGSGAPKFEPHRDRGELLKQLWAAFRARHGRYQERFARRYEDVKRLGATLKTEAETSPPLPRKIGPNAPCPCGSGRKFKKCCRRRRR